MEVNRRQVGDYHLGDFFALLVFVICIIFAITFPEAASSLYWWLLAGACVLVLWCSRRIKVYPTGTLGIFARQVLPIWIIGALLLIVAYKNVSRGVFYILVAMVITLAVAAIIPRSRKAINRFLDHVSDILRFVGYICKMASFLGGVLVIIPLHIFWPDYPRSYDLWIIAGAMAPAILIVLLLMKKGRRRRKERILMWEKKNGSLRSDF